MSKRSTAIALGMLVLVAASPLAGMAMAINFDASAAQNPQIETDVTRSTHQMGWGPTTYEDDSGDVTELDAEVNETKDNPYSYALDGVNASDYAGMPHSVDDVSSVDAGEWSKDMAGSAGSATIANTETEPGVDAVSLSTSSQTSGDTAKFTFSNFSVTSDAEKRMMQVGVNINTLESGADVEVRAVDADGDYVNATAAQDQTGGESEIASATGDGYMFQRQVGQMTVHGSGDGEMGEIQETVVVVEDANADVDIYALNAESMSKWDFGTERVDVDNDGDLEDSTVHEVNGSSAGDISIKSLSTIGNTFDSATLHDVTAPMIFTADKLSDEDISEDYNDATNYPNFDKRADVHYRLSLPAAYDLSYSNAELEDTVELPGGRYETVEYAEGTGDTDLGNISDDDYTDLTSSYDSAGDSVTVDSTVSVDTNMVMHYDYLLTSSEFDALSAADAAGGAGVLGGGSGGILSSILSVPGAIFGGLLGLLGIRRMGA